jgi:hypothetical protein
MARKNTHPESDQSVRKSHPAQGDTDTSESSDRTVNAQTSTKTGKHSSVEKLSASRPNFGEGRGAQPVDGAFGFEENKQGHSAARGPSPGMNQYRCETCGRYFNVEAELLAHETECRLAKAATNTGR